MAAVNYSDFIAFLRGKLGRESDIIYRTRFGRNHAYRLLHPYKGPLAESRKAAISQFSQAVEQCKLELADPERKAYWQKEFERYQRRANRRFFGPRDKKKYATLRGYVIAQLSAQLKSAG